MDSTDTLFVLDLSHEFHLRPLVIEGMEIARRVITIHRRFLVDCGGELLLLMLVRIKEINYFARLEVFQLESSVDRERWVKKESLGNWAIFIGHDSRLPGLVVQNPERWGGKSNGVYIATNNEHGEDPWAMIKLGDKIDMLDQESPLRHLKFSHELSSAWVRPGF